LTHKRHRVPPEIIVRAVWLCCRIPLSRHLVEGLLLERGIIVSREIMPGIRTN
jgi:transposase-like protein